MGETSRANKNLSLCSGNLKPSLALELYEARNSSKRTSCSSILSIFVVSLLSIFVVYFGNQTQELLGGENNSVQQLDIIKYFFLVI